MLDFDFFLEPYQIKSNSQEMMNFECFLEISKTIVSLNLKCSPNMVERRNASGRYFTNVSTTRAPARTHKQARVRTVTHKHEIIMTPQLTQVFDITRAKFKNPGKVVGMTSISVFFPVNFDP